MNGQAKEVQRKTSRCLQSLSDARANVGIARDALKRAFYILKGIDSVGGYQTKIDVAYDNLSEMFFEMREEIRASIY